MSFKDRLRKEIENKGLLIKEMSAKVGISNSTFLSYIDARGVLPNIETGVKIAKILNVSVEYLVTGKDETIDTKKRTDIQDIVKDLYFLDQNQIEIIKRMIHGLRQ
ncbi:MAG: helix-turn-helix domain-containing protein [Treponema sp.]